MTTKTTTARGGCWLARHGPPFKPSKNTPSLFTHFPRFLRPVSVCVCQVGFRRPLHHKNIKVGSWLAPGWCRKRASVKITTAWVVASGGEEATNPTSLAQGPTCHVSYLKPSYYPSIPSFLLTYLNMTSFALFNIGIGERAAPLT